jgi:hypothetical protein
MHVLYGAAGGLNTTGDMYFDQDTAGVDETAEASDGFGIAIAAGDFDNDDRDDLAVGASGELGPNGEASMGAAHILYGSPTGVTATNDQLIDSQLEGVPGPALAGQYFGGAIATGDFNGDVYDDVAIAGVGYDYNGTNPGAGAVWVLRGTSGQVTPYGSVMLTRSTPNVAGVPDANDAFGIGLAVGDFDGDGREDLAIGAYGQQVGGVAAGAVHVLFGCSDRIPLCGGAQEITQETAGVAGSSVLEDFFGFGVGSGDYDDDGRDDLFVAAPFKDVSGQNASGMAWVLFGTGDGPSGAGSLQLSQDAAGIGDSAEPGDQFGRSLFP